MVRASGVCALEAVGPAAGAVVDARDFNSRAAHSVGDDVRRFGYHEFAGAGDASKSGCGGRRRFGAAIDVTCAFRISR